MSDVKSFTDKVIELFNDEIEIRVKQIAANFTTDIIMSRLDDCFKENNVLKEANSRLENKLAVALAALEAIKVHSGHDIESKMAIEALKKIKGSQSDVHEWTRILREDTENS